MNMICKTNDAKHAGCHYGNHCCPSILHTAGHVVKRRTLKRRERSQWKRDVRDNN